MVDVTNGADVHVRLGPHAQISLCHVEDSENQLKQHTESGDAPWHHRDFWCPGGNRTRDLSPLPRSALPLSHKGNVSFRRTGQPLERETGIEPASLAWKAKVLPLNYSAVPGRHASRRDLPCAPCLLVERAGFEPAYYKPADLQSAAINHSATSPAENLQLCHQTAGPDKWGHGRGTAPASRSPARPAGAGSH